MNSSKHLRRTIFCAPILLLAAAAPALSETARACKAEDLKGMDTDEVWSLAPKAEGDNAPLSPEPILTYPNGTKIEGAWGFTISVLVSETGSVICHEPLPKWSSVIAYSSRRQVLSQSASWRYRPQPQRRAIRQFVYEQEAPQTHVPVPDATGKDWSVSLILGQTNILTLTSRGQATFETGSWSPFVAPEGRYSYTVPEAEVRELMDDIRAADFWSLRPAYRFSYADVTATTAMRVQIGSDVKGVVEENGLSAGMPVLTYRLIGAVARAGQLDTWHILSRRTLQILDANSFIYASQAGADMAVRSVLNPEVADDAIAGLIDRGVPTEGGRPIVQILPMSDGPGPPMPLIVAAAGRGRAPIVKRLAQSGAFLIAGQPDKTRIDQAFRLAITSGSIETVDLILTYQPSVTMPLEHPVWEPPRATEPPPVSVLFYVDARAKDAAVILRRLLDYGAPANSAMPDGETVLMHFMYHPELAELLVAHGADINARDLRGNTALLRSVTPETILWLLDHGADPCIPDKDGNSVSAIAKDLARPLVSWREVSKRLATYACSAD